MSLKKVTAADVSHGIYRRQWTSGKFYDMWRHDYDGNTVGQDIDTGADTYPINIAASNYYVISSDKVFICLSNNGGAASYVDPASFVSGDQSQPFITADSYMWKFIATTGATEIKKFQSTYYHPVKTLTVAPGAGDTYYAQWSAQTLSSTNYPGAIFVTEVTNQGSGYSQVSPPSVTIDGDGTGATAVAYVSDGRVVKIEMTNYGTGYTWARVSITPSAGGITATGKAILTPIKGLGADPVRDLSAHFAIISSEFVEAEGNGDFTVINDYRQIGLVVDPLEAGSSTPLSLATATAPIGLMISRNVGSDAFPADSILTAANGAKGYIVDSKVVGSPETGILVRVIRTETENAATLGSAAADFVSGQTVSAGNGSSSGTITAVLNAASGGAEVEKYTGDIIYYENRRAVQRAPDQTETVIITFEF